MIGIEIFLTFFFRANSKQIFFSYKRHISSSYREKLSEISQKNSVTSYLVGETMEKKMFSQFSAKYWLPFIMVNEFN